MAEYKEDPGCFSVPNASFYIHVPFCAGACDYCDFYSLPALPGDPRFSRFVDMILRDTETLLRRFGVRRIPSLYIGGGTPSLLGARGIGSLLWGLRSLLPEWPEEVSLEANPESAGPSFLAACRGGGVTRLSLGIQTFHEASRRIVHRLGDGTLLPERLDLVREFFPAAFSADLITGLPCQDEGVLLGDIERLLLREPAHVSLYALTVDEESRPEWADRLPGRDEADRLWLLGRDALEAAGYAQYEVSNFALPGKRSVHNIRYWRMENWLAAGPAASATVIDDRTGRGFRYTVRPDLAAYLDRPGLSASPAAWGFPCDTEDLDRPALMRESCLMGFRCVEGPDGELFSRRFGRDMEDCLPRTFSRWRRRGLMFPGKTALNRDGLVFLNPFLEDVFGELEESEGHPLNCQDKDP
jgi:oxygen-independent coproporphyrinogen-3 oxidase